MASEKRHVLEVSEHDAGILVRALELAARGYGRGTHGYERCAAMIAALADAPPAPKVAGAVPGPGRGW